MNLDMPTVSLVSISVTAILGLILIFAWWQERASALTGWWGAAQIVMSLSIVVAFTASIANDANLLALGQAKMVLSAHHVDGGAPIRRPQPASGLGSRWPRCASHRSISGCIRLLR
jgi:hypothetical protein